MRRYRGAIDELEGVELGLDLGTGIVSFSYRLVHTNGTIGETSVGHLKSTRSQIPACVAYHDGVFYHGIDLMDAVRDDIVPAEEVIECYKLFLYDGELHDQPAVLVSAQAALTRAGKTVDQLLEEHLRHLYVDFKEAISQSKNTEYDPAELVLKPFRARVACPQSWSPRARQRITQASQRTKEVDVTTIASEPQAGLATYLDSVHLAGARARYYAGDYVLVIDMGCGTIDFVLFRLQDDFGVKGRLEPIMQSSGAPCGSYTVNNNIFQQIDAERVAQGGMSQACQDLGMALPELTWRLLQQIEKLKIDVDRPRNTSLSIRSNIAGGKHFQHDVTWYVGLVILAVRS